MIIMAMLTIGIVIVTSHLFVTPIHLPYGCPITDKCILSPMVRVVRLADIFIVNYDVVNRLVMRFDLI